MFKRIIWWSTGAVMGASGSWWAKRKVKRAVHNALEDAKTAVRPAMIVNGAKDRAARAIAAGRWAAHDREIALKRRFESVRTARPGPTAGIAKRPYATEELDAATSSSETFPRSE